MSVVYSLLEELLGLGHGDVLIVGNGCVRNLVERQIERDLHQRAGKGMKRQR